MVQLGGRRPPPQTEHDELESRDLIDEWEEKHDQLQPVVFAASGKEDGFVAQAQQRQESQEEPRAFRRLRTSRRRSALFRLPRREVRLIGRLSDADWASVRVCFKAGFGDE